MERLQKVADGVGTPLPVLALAWCLRRPELTSVIIGASRPDQIIENLGASDLELDDTVQERIASILEA